MGQEIQTSQFNGEDFSLFRQRLQEETSLLREYFQEGRISSISNRAGFEIEACLLDQDLTPAPKNPEFLKCLDDPLIVPELALFNVELNSSPLLLEGAALVNMHDELLRILQKCFDTANAMGLSLILTGIVPTIRSRDLTLNNISNMERYHALNDEVRKMRDGRPFYINIQGQDSLAMAHEDVMLEAATTSFQIHLQVEPGLSARYYNASIIASAPVIAACANSPYLFGKQLWQETRIPLFEQSVEVGEKDRRRVTFGSGYVEDSLLECFIDNLENYPVLIPANTDEAPHRFSHVRFHNGTIWRWNRPLIGLEEDGSLHLRLENRVLPAGPTAIDCIANAAFYYGFTTYLAHRQAIPETQMSFQAARDNFYRCAQFGLESEITWMDGKTYNVAEILTTRIIPEANDGLVNLGIDAATAARYMKIIHDRVHSGQTGAAWQIQYVRNNAADMTSLCRAYLQNQFTGIPVHEWDTQC